MMGGRWCATNNPFAVLGLKSTADADEVRAAYRNLVKMCHPDKFLDADERKAAQEKMIALNLAYEEAFRLASARKAINFNPALSQEEALVLAAKMLRQQNPQGALRQLMRSQTRDGAWYAMQGHIMMQMEQYESAHQSYREAVRREPANNEFRRGALEAAVAMKQAGTLVGRIKAILRKKK